MNEIKPAVGMSFMPGEITVAAMPEEAWNYDEATLTLPAGRYFVGDPCYSCLKS